MYVGHIHFGSPGNIRRAWGGDIRRAFFQTPPTHDPPT